MQLGIPTITDPTPECCSTIQHQENGFLCYSKEAWRKYLLELCGSVNLRTEVGLCSKKYFERNFNREDYTKRFLKFLMNDVVKH
jgi:glycosyltransferase involved in cell wall biosynthesis